MRPIRCLRSAKCARTTATSAPARTGLPCISASGGLRRLARIVHRHRRDSSQRRNTKWQRIHRSLESIRIAQPFRMPSTSCTKRGIGRRTSRSCRPTTKAQRISAHEKHTKAAQGAATGAAAGAVVGAALAWFVSIQTVTIPGLGRRRAARRGWTGGGCFGRRRRRRGAGLDRGMAGGPASDRIRRQTLRGQNQAGRHSPLRSLRQSGVVRPGEEDLERHWRPGYLLRLGGCRRLRDDG